MQYIFALLLLFFFKSFIQPTSATEDPYLLVRLMDVKLYEWKPVLLDKMEKAVDAELKYTDEKKGTACKSIDFEQEKGYPKQDARFLILSLRGICTDDEGKQHNIAKSLMTDALKRRKDQVNAAISGIIYSLDYVRIYDRNRNHLNLIIIPVSTGFVVFLFVLTFFLRRMRNAQKHRHIVSELQKKKEASAKKAQTTANIDPHANDKQRLLQLDPTVVGNVSNTMGSPKEFTNEQSTTPIRTNTTNTGVDHRFSNREYQGAQPPPPLSNKENRVPDDASFQTQRSLKSNRERMHVPFENESRFSPTSSQYPEMVSMHEQQPRVVVRSIRDDNNYPAYHQQPYEESSKAFVSIPVQIEHSGPHQRFVPPPYHSDPYYPHANS